MLSWEFREAAEGRTELVRKSLLVFNTKIRPLTFTTNTQNRDTNRHLHFVSAKDRLADLSRRHSDHRDHSIMLKTDSAPRICSFNVPIIAPDSAKSH